MSSNPRGCLPPGDSGCHHSWRGAAVWWTEAAGLLSVLQGTSRPSHKDEWPQASPVLAGNPTCSAAPHFGGHLGGRFASAESGDTCWAREASAPTAVLPGNTSSGPRRCRVFPPLQQQPAGREPPWGSCTWFRVPGRMDGVEPGEPEGWCRHGEGSGRRWRRQSPPPPAPTSLTR